MAKIHFHLYFLITLFPKDAYLQVQQPGNLIRREGEEGIHISCEIYAFEERVPFWRINGIDYVSCNLPQPFMQTSSGLEIGIVTRDMDGTTFQCLLPSQMDLSVRKSQIGVLTVTENGNSSIQVGEEFIEIDHKNIDFNEQNFTLSWRTRTLNQSCNVIRITSTRLCESVSFHDNTTAIQKRNIKLPVNFLSSEDGDSSVIDISVENALQVACPGLRLREPVRFDLNQIEIVEIPMNSSNCNPICINISQNTFILVISSSPRDIFCPIYIEEGSTCYNVSRCFGFMETFDSHFFSVCKNAADNSSFEMCFTNTVSQLKDSMKIFFLISSRPCPRLPLSTKLYTRGIQIHVKACIIDFRATEGDRYLFIGCEICANESRTPLWRINEINYTESDLPVFYIPSNGGLFITQVDLKMNETTFQCIFPPENGSLIQTSCIGVLNVDIEIDAEEIFELDLIPLDINSDNVTLAWRGSYNELCNYTNIEIEWSPLLVCDYSQSVFYNTSDNSITLPHYTPDGEDVKFNISIEGCPASTMNPESATFSFDHFETITVPFGFNNCSCMTVRRTFFLIISTTSGDVHCSVEIDDNENCYNLLSQCNDYSQIFNVNRTFLSICKDPSRRSSLYQMCFGNITGESNDIRIFITSTVNVPSCVNRDFTRKYIQGIRLEARANITLNHDNISNEICVFPTTNDCSFLPEGNHLGVSIHDISSYSVYNDNITIGTCREFESQLPAFCAPFNITLNDMVNKLQVIPQHLVEFFNYHQLEESNLCKCLEENVKVKLSHSTISEESFNLTFQYNCTTNYIPSSSVDVNIILHIESAVYQLSGCKNGSLLAIDLEVSCELRNQVLINMTQILGGQISCAKSSLIMIPIKCRDSHLLLLLLLLLLIIIPALLSFIIILFWWFTKRSKQGNFTTIGADSDSSVPAPNVELRGVQMQQDKREQSTNQDDPETMNTSNDGDQSHNTVAEEGHPSLISNSD